MPHSTDISVYVSKVVHQGSTSNLQEAVQCLIDEGMETQPTSAADPDLWKGGKVHTSSGLVR